MLSMRVHRRGEGTRLRSSSRDHREITEGLPINKAALSLPPEMPNMCRTFLFKAKQSSSANVLVNGSFFFLLSLEFSDPFPQFVLQQSLVGQVQRVLLGVDIGFFWQGQFDQ